MTDGLGRVSITMTGFNIYGETNNRNSTLSPHADFCHIFCHTKIKKGVTDICNAFLAESEGFEPPDPLRSTVFKTAAFDHSANSPICFDVGFASFSRISLSKGIAKIGIISESANFY